MTETLAEYFIRRITASGQKNLSSQELRQLVKHRASRMADVWPVVLHLEKMGFLETDGETFITVRQVTPPQNDDERVVEIEANTIKTEADLLKAANVDPEEWYVVEFTVTKTDQAQAPRAEGKSKKWKRADARPLIISLFHVRARLKRRPGFDVLKAKGEALLEMIEAHAPSYAAIHRPSTTPDHLLEISPFDLHVGKLAWDKETGEDYDSEIAIRRLMWAANDALYKAQAFEPGMIVIPIGNDLFHSDSPDGATTKGTRLDVDTRHSKMFVLAEEAMISVIDRARQVAKVKVLVVPGNHDRDTCFKLGRVLNAWYRKAGDVDIDVSPKLRKYLRWGTVGLGFTHGNEEKLADLPLIMATEEAEMWAETSHREWHIGHRHKKEETRYTAGDSFKGVRVRVLPSLSSADAWHYRKGYVGELPTMESYIWSASRGYVGHFSHTQA